MQLVASFANPCACVHALASQSVRQLSWKPPRPPPKQPNAHVRMSEQVVAMGQLPQSSGQLLQVSPSLQTPLPHTAQLPQSAGQEMHVSSCEQ